MTESKTDNGSIGFVGLGAMGAAIAEQLVGDSPLYVCDLDRSRAAELELRGATFAGNQQIARSCNVVITCLPRPADVNTVLFGHDGLAAALRRGSIVIDMTTGSPVYDREIAERLARHGIAYADAPVSGGPHGARAGTLTIMVGASAAVFAEIEAVLRTISPNVSHVGEIGAGHGMKLAANLLSACHRLATLEAMRLAMSCGVSFDQALDILNKSGGRSYVTDTIYPKFLTADGYTPQNFSLGLLHKDVALATELASDLRLAQRAAPPVKAFLTQAVERFGENTDINRVMAQWYDEAGEPLAGDSPVQVAR
jgi:3-hydroxyisobutyrate dehydrogenase-like beta-hydroxyacid dehydrogenase